VFIRKKVVRGVEYFALVENYRKDGKVRQRLVLSLNRCSTVAEAISEAAREVELFSNVADGLKEMGAERANVRMLHQHTETGAISFHSRNSALRHVAKAQARLVVLKSVAARDAICHHNNA
jgi:hypothetical protein